MGRRVGPRPWLGPRLCVRAARLEPRPQGRLAWARLSSRSLETGALLDLPERPPTWRCLTGVLGGGPPETPALTRRQWPFLIGAVEAGEAHAPAKLLQGGIGAD